MSLNSIGTITATTYAQQTAPTTSKKDVTTKDAAAKEVLTKETDTKKTEQDVAAVYEKSATTETGAVKVANPALVAQLKADAEARTAQLQSLVAKMLSKQGQTLATADDMWAFLAKGDFKADPETIAQAQKDVAEDGYWGAEQTSERILSFAKALAGDDPEKAEEMFNAFKKGFEEATGTWGKELPSLCADTYKLVEEKFNAWKNSGSNAENTENAPAETTEAQPTEDFTS